MDKATGGTGMRPRGGLGLVDLFLAVFVMLASSWLLGEGLNRLGQPAVVGQLLAGVIIGPSLLNIVQPTANLGAIQSVALFFIMLLTGLAIRPSKIIAAGKRGAIVSSVAFIVPFAAGYEVATLFGIGFVSSLTVGLAISITAVPVNSIILMEMGLLDSDLGSAVIAAGVIDDVVAFVALGMIQNLGSGQGTGGSLNVGLSLSEITCFLSALFLSEHLLRTNVDRVRRFTQRFASQMRTPGSFIAILFAFAAGVSLLAEWAGLQLSIGAFFSGLLLSELAGPERLSKADETIRGTAFGFFGPLAFAFIGTEIVVSSIGQIATLIGALLLVAVGSKLFGGYVGAKLARFPSAESVTIGFLMNSRGFVELVVSAAAFQLGLIDQVLFSVVVLIGIVTTIISPVASRMAIRKVQVGIPYVGRLAQQAQNQEPTG
jgi:Kef-type K+ transport system membrane component KefB